ncbi:MAG: hypothetical protein ACJ74E_01075 [Actinomycetes bacterium]
MRREDGFAIPTTLLMLLAAFAIVSVGVVATANVEHGSIRDRGTKSAVQLAQTGANTALLHFNRIDASAVGCTVGAGWCQGPSFTDPAGGTYTYQTQVQPYPPTAGCNSNPNVPYSLEVVGTGTSRNTNQRVDVLAHSASGVPVFCDYQVKAGKDISMDSNSHIYAGTAAGGDISIRSNATQCGPASVGIGHQFPPTGHFDGFVGSNCSSPDSTGGSGDVVLPPVNQGDVTDPTKNNDSNFFAVDRVSGNQASACWSGINATGSNGTCGTRHLNVGTNSTVTMTGSRYSFCKLTMNSNSSLLVAAPSTGSSAAYIYFDSPESCGYPSGTSQLDMDSNTRISSNDGSPVYLLFVGSTSRQTIVNLSSNTDINAACQQNFVVYAPLTDINLNSNSTYCGALAGNSIHLNSNADVRTTALSTEFTPPNSPPHYTVDRFIECTATPASPPSSGC